MPDIAGDVRGDELELLVRGRAFTGWGSMALARRLDALSGQVQLVVADRDPLPIRPGDECTVRLAGQVLLTGFVDLMDYRGGPTGRQLTVSARDTTADLVDCSELSDPGEWVGLGLEELVQAIAEPFGVEVQALFSGGTEVFDLFRRQPGETAWSAIERACRRRGILAFSSGDGRLLLSRPASSSATIGLVEGENVEGWAITVDHRSRFSLYDVRAQTSGSDAFNGAVAAEVRGEAQDEGIQRFRPLLVLGEGAMTFDDAADRAAWEASVRAARSSRLEVTVPGWRQVPRTGPVWSVNETVAVRIPSAGISQTLLVDSVLFQRSRSGTTTQLGLTRPDAYLPQPVVEDFADFLGEEE